MARTSTKRGLQTFVAACPDPQSLPEFLECLYAAQLLRMRHPHMALKLLIAQENADLARSAGVFAEIEPLNGDLSGRIQSLSPDVVYIPSPDLRTRLKLFFVGALRITGASRLGRYFRFLEVRNKKDLEKLKRHGLDLLPETVGMSLAAPGLSGKDSAVQGDLVYLSLFDEHNVSGSWPVGHAARLSRLIAPQGLRIVVPLPENAFQRKIPGVTSDARDYAGAVLYLKKHGEQVLFISPQSIQQKAAWMQRASIIVAPAGPDAVLAGLLKQPVITLHDMQSHRHQGRADHSLKPSSPLVADAGVLPFFSRLADSFDRHLMPQVEECVENCPACTHLSCVDTISPERVFEGIKRTLLPY